MADSDTTVRAWLADLRPVLDACAAERDAARGAPEVVDVGPARVDLARSGPTTTAFIVDTGALRLGDQLMTRLAVGPATAGSNR